MKFGVLGTGMVGRAISAKLLTFEHDVMIGTRDVATLTARSEPDVMGNPPFSPSPRTCFRSFGADLEKDQDYEKEKDL